MRTNRKAVRGLLLAAAASVLLTLTLNVGHASALTGSPGVDEEERYLIGLINQYRAENGLPPVVISQRLSEYAQDRANYIAEDTNNRFNHVFPPGRAAEDFGFVFEDKVTENIGSGKRAALAQLESWKNSPNHNARLLWPEAKSMGAGYAADTRTDYASAIWTLQKCETLCGATEPFDYGRSDDPSPGDDGNQPRPSNPGTKPVPEPSGKEGSYLQVEPVTVKKLRSKKTGRLLAARRVRVRVSYVEFMPLAFNGKPSHSTRVTFTRMMRKKTASGATVFTRKTFTVRLKAFHRGLDNSLLTGGRRIAYYETKLKPGKYKVITTFTGGQTGNYTWVPSTVTRPFTVR